MTQKNYIMMEEENLQTSPWIWCVSVIETFTFVLMCVCVGVCHISQNCTKKKSRN